MPEEIVPIARIALARAPLRLIAVPLGAMLLGLVGIGVGALHGTWLGLALAIVSALAVLLGALVAAMLLTLRLELDVGSLRLIWLGGSRQYQLTRGAVTRIRVRGEGAVALRTPLGWLGWTVGRGRLRGSETISVVRLAPAAALIVVPIEGSRMAIAPADEQELLNALTAVARVQQRLDAVAERARSLVLHAPPLPARRAPAAPPPPLREAEPRFMTGIERVMLEERLAAERAAALAAAEAERAAREAAAREAAAMAATAAEPVAAGGARHWRGRAAASRPRPTAPRLRLKGPRLRLPRIAMPSVPRSAVGWLVLPALPALAALVVWGVPQLTGRAAAHDPQLGALAVLLGGPAAGLAAIATRFRWPRLVPLVVAPALLALVLVGRALIG
ncbi:MAG TPA: hypothetical protein VFK93_01370 [Candidatus Limnocylindria bacterium]|nr:hypothetical protein [Candidatus Limnocylindria bacterium]